ncbi:MAG: glycoside hydrolase family 31 protein [Acidobacteriota bacterium]
MKLTLVLLLLSLPVPAFAAPMEAGSFQRDSEGVTFALETGTLRIQVCTDKIVRVVSSPTSKIPPLENFVVIRHWTRVDRGSGAVTFLDPAGEVVLKEPDGGGRSLTPVTVDGKPAFQVEQTFSSPPDERLYGLGQFQEGLWNWRGLPRELRQHNTTTVMPVLVSSRGYGLLWDNASLTDFNPLSDQVALTAQGSPNAEGNGRGPQISSWEGTFRTGSAGEYVFFARADSNRGEISISVDGREIAGIKNYWTPFSLCGTVSLPADKTCRVTVRGGKNVRLFAGLRGNETTFRSRFAQVIDYTFFYGPDLDDVVRGYREATGAAPMWPEWAFGFWQCRERYHDQQELLAAADEFRRRQIPVDLMVQDWMYWLKNSWGSYEWDPTRYPDPAAMIRKLHAENLKFMISVWSNPHGDTREELEKNHALIGEWIDQFNPVGREIRWKHLNETFFKIGTDAWWADATEPGDDGNALVGQETFLGPGDFYRNAYPLFSSEAIYQGQRATTSKKRVCILTRSAFPGEQRYASAIWSGDIAGDWTTFRRQIPAGLNFCLTGMPYWTTDTGGFWHPEDQYVSPDYNELLSRWFEWSTFCPILRVHGWETKTEMWNWLPETQKVMLAYDELRHRLLPYIYSVAWRVTSQGDTMMRALPMDFRSDTKALDTSDEYMFGPAFLVAPVTEPKATNKTVYLPAGTHWVGFWTGKSSEGGESIRASAPLDEMPLFVRAGSIVPMGPAVQYAGEKPADPMELRVYRGADGAFTLYEDEGDNYDYERGVHATIPISWSEETQTLTIGKRTGQFPDMPTKRTFRIVWVSPEHGIGGDATREADAEVTYTGTALTIPAR